jgi:hypothetical protein
VIQPRLLPRPQPYRPRSVHVPPAILTQRLERFYIACVAFVVGAAGMAVGFTFGIVPYYGATDASMHDKFFSLCVAAGTLLGVLIGFVNGMRLSRASQPSPTSQKRLLAYLRRRGESRMPERTLNRISVRPSGLRQV